MNQGFPPLEEFLKMDDEKVRELVSSSPNGQVGMLVPDGNRKAGLISWDCDPSKKDFDKELFKRMHSHFLDVLKIFFRSGVQILFVPLMAVNNFDRGKDYMEAAMSDGLVHFFKDPSWLSFYEDFGIRVIFYGDRELVRKKGFHELVRWTDELEERTMENTSAILYLGLACDRSWEELRLISIGMGLCEKLGRLPVRAEIINEYYKMDVPDLGFFIRPTEVRDSDMLPVLLSRNKTQMYFPISPVGFLNKDIVRSILYDTIVHRVKSGGKKMYSKDQILETDINKVKEYYRLNKGSVIGMGIREGPFWLPYNVLRLPQEGF